MNDYIPITEAETDPEAPSTSSLWKRWTKNPLAMFAGAAGAPRLQAAALDNSAAMVGWVSGNIAQLRAGGIGTYALLGGTTNAQFAVGAVYAGSSLVWSGFSVSQGVFAAIQQPVVGYGAWCCMGQAILANQNNLTSSHRFYSLFLRIA